MASVEMYDSNTREWTSMPPLATARSEHSCTAMGSLLFVVGGYGNYTQLQGRLPSVEIFDSSTRGWRAVEEFASIPVVASANAVVCEVTERPSHRWTSG